MKKLNLRPYKIVELPTGIRVEHYRNGKLTVSLKQERKEFNKFYQWWTEKVKGNHINNETFNRLITKF